MNISYWLTRIWNFIDERDIDKHIVCLAIFYGSFRVMRWSFEFAQKLDTQPGLEVAAIIGSITVPLTVILPFALKFYFNARTE